MRSIDLNGRAVGSRHPCLVIAEAGVNHNGNMDLAFKLIDAAKDAGADAVKFQSFVVDELVTPTAPKAEYQKKTTDERASQREMLKQLALSPTDQGTLRDYCDKVGVLYLCTPYENESIDLLDRLEVAAYKVASTDATNIPMLRYMASKGRPVILSTGMCTLEEVEGAVRALRGGGLVNKIALLHCTSEYPAPFGELNLRAMETLRTSFDCPVGYSDHSSGIGASPWAVALGASIIEKHFTLNRSLPGPDHRASLEPGELKDLVVQIRSVEAALGDGLKQPTAREAVNKPMMQKSLVARRAVRAGEQIMPDMLTCKRPATGFPPRFFDEVVGKTATRAIAKDELISRDNIDWKA